MYFEDVDWCRRFREAGYRVVYYPHAQVVHHHRRQSADLNWIRAIIQSRTARIHIKSGILYFLTKAGLRKKNRIDPLIETETKKHRPGT
jgi:GT2 family glycosyltransferase